MSITIFKELHALSSHFSWRMNNDGLIWIFENDIHEYKMAFTIIQVQKSKIGIKKLCNLCIKETGKRRRSKYFITTPIFYVNADPHIGHLYTAVIGDAANRFQKLKNPDVETKFLVGTDEHGLKISQSAKGHNVEVKEYCDKVSQKYKNLFDTFSIEADDFIRTTEERHVKAATAFWNKIFSKNLIYKDKYSGWYCISDEMFVSEHLLDTKFDKNGIRYTIDGNKPVEFVEEVNYKFKLSNFQTDLLYWLKDDVVRPKPFQEDLCRWIEEGKVLSDLSVSRPADRISWGIPVPGDPSQTIYVWMDALSSYLCANGYPETSFRWPPDVQIIGKDILRFHGIFWPAFLIAADLEPPKLLFCHSHWLKDDEKMSKSKGNVVDPFKHQSQLTSDGLRYFLLRDGVPHNDGNFSVKKAIAYLNSELADSLGNLLSRCSGSSLNPYQVFPPLPEKCDLNDVNCINLMEALGTLPETVINHFEEFNFYKGIDAICSVLRLTNKFFNDMQPWKFKKQPEMREHMEMILHLSMESLRVCGILLQPIIPNISNNVLNQLSVPMDKRNLRDLRPFSWEMKTSKAMNLSSKRAVVFPKILM